MDCDPETLTRLLLDPCLTTGEARREAEALGRRDRTAEQSAVILTGAIDVRHGRTPPPRDPSLLLLPRRDERR